MANNTSPHILSTATNLLGFCLFVITSLHFSNYAEASIVDEFTSVIAMLLVFSCLFSFVSIRTKSEKREEQMERIADYLFATSLIGILTIVFLIVFQIAK